MKLKLGSDRNETNLIEVIKKKSSKHLSSDTLKIYGFSLCRKQCIWDAMLTGNPKTA